MEQASPKHEQAQPLLERLSDALQEAIKVVVGTHRKPPRRLKSFLNGTWFGHPLHPVITDVPIAAWLLTAIFDIIWLIAPTQTSWAGLGAFVAVIVGFHLIPECPFARPYNRPVVGGSTWSTAAPGYEAAAVPRRATALHTPSWLWVGLLASVDL